MSLLSRRGFLSGAAAVAVAPFVPAAGLAYTGPVAYLGDAVEVWFGGVRLPGLARVSFDSGRHFSPVKLVKGHKHRDAGGQG